MNCTNKSHLVLPTILFIVSTVILAQANEWIPVTGTESLKSYMSGLTAERELAGGEISRGEYHADGTGTLHSWGAQILRTWSVKGDNQKVAWSKSQHSDMVHLAKFRFLSSTVI